MILSGANLPVIDHTVPPALPDPTGGAVKMVEELKEKLSKPVEYEYTNIKDNGGGGGSNSYQSAIGEAKKAYEETGSIEEAKRAYGNVMQAGIDAAKKDDVIIPSAPGPECPEGERLYMVSGMEDVGYVYAGPEATKEDIQELAGFPGFVTTVMSPEAYGGEYEFSKIVTTADGRQVKVPYDPTKEAKSEFTRLTGIYPFTSRLTETGSEFLAQIREGLISGTYEKPLLGDNPTLSAWMGQYGLSERAAHIELSQIADRAYRVATIPLPSGKWAGMTANEAILASSFFETYGQLGKAERIKEFYATIGHSETFTKRAEAVGYGVFATLKDYKPEDGGGYYLAVALADKSLGPERDAFAQELIPFFGEDLVGTAVVQAGVLDKLGSDEVSYEKIGGLLASGALTDTEVDTTYGPGTSGQVRNYCSQYGCGVQTMGFGGLGVEEAPKGVARISWDGLGALLGGYGGLSFWNPVKGKYEVKTEPLKDWVVNVDGNIHRFTSKQEAVDWAWDSGYQPQIGFQTSIDLARETILGALQTPEATLIMAGMAQFGQAPITQAASQMVPTRLATWAQAPVTLGPKWVQVGLTGAKTALTRLVAPTFATTTAATFAGLSYTPPSPEVRGAESFAAFKASPEYTSSYEDYMREAGSVYDRAASELGPNEAMEISREAFLQQAADEFDPQARAWFTEQAAGGMAYQPGFIGLLGRGGEVLNIPIQKVQSLPGPAWAKGLATGVYQVFAPLSVTSQLYPSKGPAALTTLIPYYGPITAATALTWKDLPWYGKALGVGFTVAPFALPAMGYAIGKATAPSTHWPFPKSIISYGGKGKVYVNLGKGYGWRSYANALELLKRDVALQRMYQPPSVFGAQRGFWPGEPSPMVLRLGGRSVGPGVFPTTPVLTYGTMPGLNLAQSPYLPRGGSVTVPFDIPGDIFRGLSTEGTVDIFGATVYGEAPGLQPMRALGLGPSLSMPRLQVAPSSFSMGVRGLPGWATSSISKPPLSLEPYTWFEGGPFGGGGVVGTIAPTVPIVGAPYQTTLSTLTMTQEGLLRQLHALGVIPSTVGRAGISISPGVTPVTSYKGILSPLLLPGIGISPIPLLDTGVSPTPFITPSPVPYPSPAPGPVITPGPTDIIIRPTTPRIRIVPPPWFPTFGAKLGGGRGRKLRKGGLMGVGTWGFAGFPVSGPHPLYLGTTGYTWMEGKEVPYGAGKKVPRIRTRRTSKGGLVRVR